MRGIRDDKLTTVKFMGDIGGNRTIMFSSPFPGKEARLPFSTFRKKQDGSTNASLSMTAYVEISIGVEAKGEKKEKPNMVSNGVFGRQTRSTCVALGLCHNLFRPVGDLPG